MKALIVLASLLMLYPAPIRNAGYCPDITSPECPVRAWWPRGSLTEATGTEAYWWSTDGGRVCFVTPAMYRKTGIGQVGDCLWRDRPLDRND